MGALATFVLFACTKAHPLVTQEDAAPPAVPVATVPPVVTISDQIAKLSSASAAIGAAVPQMADSVNSVDDDGTILLARWSAKRLRWADVAVTKNETTFQAVLKDPDEARGKRLCIAGSIVEIVVVKTPDGKLFDGILHDYNGNLFKFAVAGSSGDLVAQSQARLCGFVTGKYDYSNSGGGTGHAIKVVGMFDLPANKT